VRMPWNEKASTPLTNTMTVKQETMTVLPNAGLFVHELCSINQEQKIEYPESEACLF